VKELQGKVAVITGAASGIGRALARRCATEDMKVVLADVEQAPLDKTERELREAGAAVLAVQADVSRARDVERIARETLDFVPIMLEQATPCHIVNTTSPAGLLALPAFGAYNASKAGIVAVSETLQRVS